MFHVINKNTKRIHCKFDNYSDACICMHRMNQEDAYLYNDHSYPYAVVEAES